MTHSHRTFTCQSKGDFIILPGTDLKGFDSSKPTNFGYDAGSESYDGCSCVRNLLSEIDYEYDLREATDISQRKKFCNGWHHATSLSSDDLKTPFKLTWYNLGFCMGRRFGARATSDMYPMFAQFAQILDYDQGIEAYCHYNQCLDDLQYKFDNEDRHSRIPMDQISSNVERAETLVEGALKRILADHYERNSEARQQCIAEYGTKCYICHFDFSRTYGSVMDGFIHVHHLKPLSKAREQQIVNPILDLVPVCPNCHSVIHSKDPCYTVEEIRIMIDANRNKPEDQ